MALKSIRTISLCHVLLFFGKCLSLSFDCDSIYINTKWPLVENDEYCGDYSHASPYTYLEPEEKERSMEANNGIPPNISARVLKGKSTLKAYPWLAQLIWRGYSSAAPLCGGSLINKRYVLTAVHCVSRMSDSGVILEIRPANEFRIRLGAHKRYNVCERNGTCIGFQQFNLEKIITPDDIINKSFDDDDIALIRLDADAGFAKGVISPICLPKCTMLNEFFEGKKMVFAGWGANNSVPSIESPVVLQKYYPRIKGPSDCTSYGYDREKMICTGGNVGQPCTGDAGGPLMLLSKEVENEEDALTIRNIYYQIGIYSGKIGRCNVNKHKTEDESTYTRVAKYMVWILQNVEA